MADLKLLKKVIFDEDRIEELLDLLGCNNIHPENGIIAASLPNGNNKRSVQVRLDESLSANIRSRHVNGDIFTLVSYIQFGCQTKDDFDKNLMEAKNWIIDNLDLDASRFDKEIERRVDPNKWLKDIKKKRKSEREVLPNDVIPESVKERYYMKPYYPWIEEGITTKTQIEWEVGFDWESGRVVTMVRNINGDLIGVKGRALDDDDPYKYLYVEPLNKSIELFGLHKTLPYILEKKEIILFEGYKSVMKAWQMGYKNCASIEGDDISLEQIALIKSLGIDINIVLCFDKDKKKDDVEDQASKFVNRTVYYTLDKKFKGIKPLLREKDSPVDRGEEVWKKLYSRKYKYQN